MALTPSWCPKSSGHETTEHAVQKSLVVAKLVNSGCGLVIPEERSSDVVASRCWNKAWIILAFELERSSRNVRRNLVRNFTNGADYVFVLCPNPGLFRPVVRQIARVADQVPLDRVFCMTLERFLESDLTTHILEREVDNK